MTQFLLVSFSNNAPSKSVESRSDSQGKFAIDKFVTNIVGNLGKVTEFEQFKKRKDDEETKKNRTLPSFSDQDQLVRIADDLAKLDTNTFGILTRVARSIMELQRKIQFDNENGFSDISPNKKFDPISAPSLEIYEADEQGDKALSLAEYLRKFKWDEKMQPIAKDMNELYNYFSREVQHQDEELRIASNSYTEAGNKVIALRRRNDGSLLVRNLDEVASSKMTQVTKLKEYNSSKAKKDPIYVNTLNITTILVVVKTNIASNFEKNFNKDIDYVVPVPPQVLESDNDFTCYTVYLLRTNIDDYKTYCKENGWHVRDFNYDPDMKSKMEDVAFKTVEQYVDQSNHYAEHLQTTFTHLACCWIHVKALRVFAESVLLYGIPINFRAFLKHTTPKNIPKIHKELERVFNDGLSDGDKKDDDDDPADDDDLVHPYFCSQINLLGLT